MIYSIVDSMPIGEGEENELDKYFSRWYGIKRATSEQQRNGIDRVFTDKMTGTEYTVEYKSDFTAARTGNAFIETISVDTVNKLGWAYTSHAQIIAYYIPPKKAGLLLDALMIKFMLSTWLKTCQQVSIPNRGRRGDTYNTIGLKVPLKSLAPYCIKKFDKN